MLSHPLQVPCASAITVDKQQQLQHSVKYVATAHRWACLQPVTLELANPCPTATERDHRNATLSYNLAQIKTLTTSAGSIGSLTIEMSQTSHFVSTARSCWMYAWLSCSKFGTGLLTCSSGICSRRKLARRHKLVCLHASLRLKQIPLLHTACKAGVCHSLGHVPLAYCPQ